MSTINNRAAVNATLLGIVMVNGIVAMSLTQYWVNTAQSSISAASFEASQHHNNHIHITVR